MATSNIQYYRTKAKSYLANIRSVDLLTIHDQSSRHKAIKSFIATLTSIQGLIKMIAEKCDRDKEGWFPELISYNNNIKHLKKYTEDYTQDYMIGLLSHLPESDFENIDKDALTIEENKIQLEMVLAISKLENFIENTLAIEKKTKKKDEKMLKYSLVDLGLI